MQRLESFPDSRELRLSVFARDPWLQTALHLKIVIGAVLDPILRACTQGLRHRRWHVEMRTEILVDSSEALGSDADDAEINSIDPHRAADDRTVGGELGTPEIIGEHGDGTPSGNRVFFSKKAAAERRLYAEHLEEVAADHQRAAKMSAVIGRLRHAYPVEIKSREAIKGTRLVTQVPIVRIRDAAHSSRLIRRIGADRYHRTRVIDRQRTQEESVCKAENGAIRANAKRERQCRNRCEARIAHKQPQPVTDFFRKLLDKSLHRRPSPVGPSKDAVQLAGLRSWPNIQRVTAVLGWSVVQRC